MKKLVKDVLEVISGQKVNNEHHATIVLKQKLIDLGGEIYVDIADDIPMLIDFIKIYDPSIEKHITPAFLNTFYLADTPSRVGKILKPKDKKVDRNILTPMAESIVKMHSDLLKFDLNQSGIVFLTIDNLLICTTKRWMLIKGPVREFSSEVVFNQVKDTKMLEEIIPNKYLDGKSIGLANDNHKGMCIKHLTTVELINIFVDRNLVEKLCNK